MGCFRGRGVTGSVYFAGTLLIGSPTTSGVLTGACTSRWCTRTPTRSLNPIMPIGAQITEALRAHQPVGKAQTREQAVELLVSSVSRCLASLAELPTSALRRHAGAGHDRDRAPPPAEAAHRR